MRPTVKALVLGSTQSESQLNLAAVERAGLELVRRRSGGGAVLVLPGVVTWLDLIIPADDVLWSDDVGRAMYPIGELWHGALADLGVSSTVHRGGLQHSEWSRQVCFAGVGSGEVLDTNGKKLVGISQRRTRYAARFQTMMYHANPNEELLRYFKLEARDEASLRTVLGATTGYVPLPYAELVAALRKALDSL